MNKHYSNELKEQVVKEYLEGAKMNELVLRYESRQGTNTKMAGSVSEVWLHFRRARNRKRRRSSAKCGCI